MPIIAAIKNELTIIIKPTSDCQIFVQAALIFLGSPPALIKPKPAKIKLKKAKSPAMIKTSRKIEDKKDKGPVSSPVEGSIPGVCQAGTEVGSITPIGLSKAKKEKRLIITFI